MKDDFDRLHADVEDLQLKHKHLLERTATCCQSKAQLATQIHDGITDYLMMACIYVIVGIGNRIIHVITQNYHFILQSICIQNYYCSMILVSLHSAHSIPYIKKFQTTLITWACDESMFLFALNEFDSPVLGQFYFMLFKRHVRYTG